MGKSMSARISKLHYYRQCREKSKKCDTRKLWTKTPENCTIIDKVEKRVKNVILANFWIKTSKNCTIIDKMEYKVKNLIIANFWTKTPKNYTNIDKVEKRVKNVILANFWTRIPKNYYYYRQSREKSEKCDTRELLDQNTNTKNRYRFYIDLLHLQFEK